VVAVCGIFILLAFVLLFGGAVALLLHVRFATSNAKERNHDRQK
jgi:hypothetical protein